MLIEQKTSYAYKLKYLENPTFDKVRGFAKSFIDDLPKELVDELYSQLDRGVVQIDSEPQMLVYLYSFGNMHQAKLNKAFENIPEILFDQPEINIIDYGCGQAIGTMCYIDFIRQKGVSQKVKRVTLIEPSEICLKRAALHVSAFCPDADIVTVNKEFDDLDAADIVCDDNIPTLHILSNVLDLDFDLDRFAELISDNLKGYNQFVCVGPYFGFSDKDKRMENLYLLLNGEENYSKFFDRFELNVERPWTAQIRCFSVGELEEDLSTEVTDEDIKNGIKDEYGVVYSRDGKRLLECKNKKIECYSIKCGTKVICDFAFDSCIFLYHITIPNSIQIIGKYSFEFCDSLCEIMMSNSIFLIDNCAFQCCINLLEFHIPQSVKYLGDYVFRECLSLQEIIIPKKIEYIGCNPFCRCNQIKIKSLSPILSVIDSVLVNLNCHKIIAHFGNQNSVFIPDSVTMIGESSFMGDDSLRCITIPPYSVTSIDNKVFYGCASLQQITIPNSVMSIGNGVFDHCESLQQIIIPEGSEEHFKQMLPEELWDKLYCVKKAIEPQRRDDLPF